MIGSFYAVHRKAVFAVGAICICAVLLGGLIVIAHGHHPTPPPAAPVQSHPLPRVSAPAKVDTRTAHAYHPRYVQPPQTPKQAQLASALAAAESPEQIAAGEALRVPVGRYSAHYPAVPASDTSDEFSYAKAWVSELLHIDYRSQSRANLLAWAIAGEAADTLPGVPANVEDKSLYDSLAAPGVDGGPAQSPVPVDQVWAGMAVRGVVQRVSDLEVSVDPAWTQLVGEGFVPNDPLLSFVDVSGILTVTAESTKPSTRTFRLVLTVGSALHHPGYGAVSVADWSVGSWPAG